MPTPDRSDRRKSEGAWLAALAAGALAVTNITSPLVYGAGSNPSTILLLRSLAFILLAGLWLGATGQLRRLSRVAEIRCIVSGLLFTLAGAGLLTSFSLLPVSLAILILYLFPLLTALIESLAARSLPDRLTIFLMLLALGGLALALDAGADGLNIKGALYALLASFGVAGTYVWNHRMLADVAPEQRTFRMFCVGAVVFGIYVLMKGSFALPQTGRGSAQLILMLACFSIAFFAMFRSIHVAGAVRSATIMNLEPVITIILSVLILSEQLNFGQVVGASMVLIAVLASQFPSLYGEATRNVN